MGNGEQMPFTGVGEGVLVGEGLGVTVGVEEGRAVKGVGEGAGGREGEGNRRTVGKGAVTGGGDVTCGEHPATSRAPKRNAFHVQRYTTFQVTVFFVGLREGVRER